MMYYLSVQGILEITNSPTFLTLFKYTASHELFNYSKVSTYLGVRRYIIYHGYCS
jgi:hypothetical protein